jgi:putative aldouronate transport system substrate-binding protein
MKKGIICCLVLLYIFNFTACNKVKYQDQKEVNELSPTNLNKDYSEKEVDLYGFENPVTLKVGLSYPFDFSWAAYESPLNNSWMELYHENNIFPEIIYEVEPSQVDSKLTTSIMLGNYPDLLYTNKSDYLYYIRTGVIADITDEYEKYASDELKNYMNSDGGAAINSLKVGGKLYGLPRLLDYTQQIPMMFIRKDWLDNLNLKVPETTEELAKVAYAFTYNDPDGNGINDTYGLALDGINIFNSTIGNTEPLFNAFGAYLGSDGMAIIRDERDQIIWGASNIQGMKSALAFLQDLYKAGSLTRDFITMDSNTVFDEAGTGRCGIWFGPNWAGMIPTSESIKLDKNTHIVAVPVPDGIAQGGSKVFLPSSMVDIYSISSQCENPEVLIKLMNLSVQKICYPISKAESDKYNGDAINYTGWKASLIHTTSPVSGYIDYKTVSNSLNTGDETDLTLAQKDTIKSIKTYLDTIQTGSFDPDNINHILGIAMYTVIGDPESSWVTIEKIVKEDRFIRSAYDGLPSRNVSEISTVLKKYMVETIVKIITGDDVDSYDVFFDNWCAMGGQAAMDEAKHNSSSNLD